MARCCMRGTAARARKSFAAGLGRVRGRDVVSEEVGEVGDDEEDYGAWQGEGEGVERVDVWRWG